MRNVIAALLFLLPTSAIAGTYIYTPVHVAPVIHVAPVVHVNPGVHTHAVVRPGPSITRAHSHHTPLPVVVSNVPQNPKKCVEKPDSKGCQKK
jgi:hypothetical protein